MLKPGNTVVMLSPCDSFIAAENERTKFAFRPAPTPSPLETKVIEAEFANDPTACELVTEVANTGPDAAFVDISKSDWSRFSPIKGIRIPAVDPITIVYRVCADILHPGKTLSVLKVWSHKAVSDEQEDSFATEIFSEVPEKPGR